MDIREFLRRTFLYQDIKDYDFTLEPSEKETVENGPSLTEEEREQKGEYTSDTKVLEYTEEKNIFPSIDVNLEYLKSRYNSMVNSDIIIRNFTLTARNKQFKAFLFYIDGMVDTKLINDFILNPLMLRNQSNTYHDSENQIISEAVTNNITVRKIKKFDMSDYIYNCLIPQNSVNREKEFSKIFDSINSGNCALFIDTLDVCFDIDVKGFKQRGIDTPKRTVEVYIPDETQTDVTLVPIEIELEDSMNDDKEDFVLEALQEYSLISEDTYLRGYTSVGFMEPKIKSQVHGLSISTQISISANSPTLFPQLNTSISSRHSRINWKDTDIRLKI